MSFATFGAEGKKPNAVSSLYDQFGRDINQLIQNVASLNHFSRILGSDKDTVNLRRNINNTINQSESLRDNLKSQLITQPDGLVRDKLLNQFNLVLRDYSKVKNEIDERLLLLGGPITEETPLLSEHEFKDQNVDLELGQSQSQHQIQTQKGPSIVQNELNYHSDLINQRQEAIKTIQSGVQDINHIFQTLDNIVVQQGEQLNNVEGNIINYARDTQLASGELNRAEDYQRRKSKWCFILFLIILFIFIIALLISL